MDEFLSTDSDNSTPFKLCFTPKILVGRSNVLVGKPLNLPPIITGKFYTTKDEMNIENMQKCTEMFNVIGPKEKYERPLTENQKYGWYHDIILSDIKDRRLNYHKHTDTLIMEHLMNYARIRS